MSRVRAKAPAAPIAIPIDPRKTASRKTIRSTSAEQAPSAIRIPIS